MLRLCIPGLPSDLVTAVAGPRGDTGTDETGGPRRMPGASARAVAEARPRAVVLVLDDAEVLDGATESTAFLAALCRQAAPPLHVVVASRGDVPFPVARLRGQGLLAELAAADLAFTGDETTAVLRQAVEPTGALDQTEALGPTRRTNADVVALAARAAGPDGRVARRRPARQRGPRPGQCPAPPGDSRPPAAAGWRRARLSRRRGGGR